MLTFVPMLQCLYLAVEGAHHLAVLVLKPGYVLL